MLSLKSGNTAVKTIAVKPDWEKSVKSQDDKYEVLETALMAQGGFGFAAPEVYAKYLETKEQKWLMPESRLVTPKDKKSGELHTVIMSMAGTKECLETKKFSYQGNSYLKKDKDFSGYVFFHELDGSFANGWKFEKSKVTHMVSQVTGNPLAIGLKSAWVCTTVPVYGWTTDCVGAYYYTSVPGAVVNDWVYNYTDCYSYQIITGSYQVCNYSESGSGVTGGGGTYAPSTPAPLVKFDPSFLGTKAECVYNKLQSAQLLQSLLESFIGSQQYQITFKVVGSLPISESLDQPYGQCKDNGVGTMTVSINAYYFDKVTPVSLAKTILHETIHANIYQKVASIGGYDNLSADNFERLFAYYQTYGKYDLDHCYMAAYYVPKLAQSLQKFDGYKYSLDYYKALSWSGLQYTYEWQQMSKAQKDEIFRKVYEINSGNKVCTN